ncbi:MAG: hypothetical protein M3Y93_01370, partial [Pseudomonadota bacterium]|nr:hypothetical protein [Pseudomonadota bacterium]
NCSRAVLKVWRARRGERGCAKRKSAARSVGGYHDCLAVTGDEYGNEGGMPHWAFRCLSGVKALVKIGNYHANGFGHNDTRIWFHLD